MISYTVPLSEYVSYSAPIFIVIGLVLVLVIAPIILATRYRVKVVVCRLILLATVVGVAIMLILIFYPYLRCGFVGVIVKNNTVVLSVPVVPECMHVMELKRCIYNITHLDQLRMWRVYGVACPGLLAGIFAVDNKHIIVFVYNSDKVIVLKSEEKIFVIGLSGEYIKEVESILRERRVPVKLEKIVK